MENKNNLANNKSKTKFYILSILAVAAIVFYINYSGVFAASNTQAMFDKSFNELSALIRKITTFMVGASIVSGFATVIFHLIKLGSSGGNPQARAKVLQDMLTTIICIALLGSFNMVLYFIVSLGKTMS